MPPASPPGMSTAEEKAVGSLGPSRWPMKPRAEVGEKVIASSKTLTVSRKAPAEVFFKKEHVPNFEIAGNSEENKI